MRGYKRKGERGKFALGELRRVPVRIFIIFYTIIINNIAWEPKQASHSIHIKKLKVTKYEEKQTIKKIMAIHKIFFE